MFDGQSIEDLPDYLRGVSLDGINLDELNTLDQFLDSNPPQSANSEQTDESFDETTACCSHKEQIQQPARFTARKGISKPQSRLKPKVCAICVFKTVGTYQHYHGVPCCHACERHYRITVASNQVHICLFGNGKCRMEEQKNYGRCKFCRFWKCIQLGMSKGNYRYVTENDNFSQTGTSDQESDYNGKQSIDLSENKYRLAPPKQNHPKRLELEYQTDSDHSSMPTGRENSKLCLICGSVRDCSRYHGVMSCQCCTKFYRRNIEISQAKSCVSRNGLCRIEEQPIKRKCEFCRFWKCVKLGMGRLNWREPQKTCTSTQDSYCFSKEDGGKQNNISNPLANNLAPLAHKTRQTYFDRNEKKTSDGNLSSIREESAESLSNSPNSKGRKSSQRCVVCSTKVYFGHEFCPACKYHYAICAQFNLTLVCIVGDGRCQILKNCFPKNANCRFCRFWKCIELGIHHKDFAREKILMYRKLDKQTIESLFISKSKAKLSSPKLDVPSQDFTSNVSTNLEGPLEVITLDDSPAASNDESTISDHELDAIHESNYNNARGNQGVTSTEPAGSPVAVDEEPIVDKYGLPPDINYNFSRWLYGDLSSFAPGSIKKKSLEEERLPTHKLRRKRKKRRLQFQQQQETERLQEQVRQQHEQQSAEAEYNNDLASYDIKFLTQDLEVDEFQPLEEIITPFLVVKHSLMNPHPVQPSITNQSASPEDDPIIKKQKLTITLETKRTIIDRRPMLRKLETLGRTNTSRNDSSNEVTSTSLIAPGEDCDSDEYEYIEVDCDNIG